MYLFVNFINLCPYLTFCPLNYFDLFSSLYSHRVLGKSSGLDDIGTVQPYLALTLLAAWVIVYLTLLKGIQSLGKVRAVYCGQWSALILRDRVINLMSFNYYGMFSPLLTFSWPFAILMFAWNGRFNEWGGFVLKKIHVAVLLKSLMALLPR